MKATTKVSLFVLSFGLSMSLWGLTQIGAHDSPESLSLSSHTGANDPNRQLILGQAKTGKNPEKESSILLNDPNMKQKWGLEKTSAKLAWEITQGSKDIVVAVIDTGADINHKDLKDPAKKCNNLWENPGETGIVDSKFCKKQRTPLALKECNKATNKVDDDRNGIVDDVHGANFLAMNNDLSDNHGHGTNIAGIIGACGGNNFGVAGVSPNVSIMVLKYFDPKSPGSDVLKSTVKAIKYAVDKGAKIINYSGGGVLFSSEEFAAIREAEKKGILFVAAAGNERSNTDEKGKHYYPADYELSNIISVTAVNREETKVLPSSNYGVQTVDIAAPGENIYSLLPNNSFGPMTGTSQATAFVTGVASLVMAHNRDFSAADVKKYILRTGDEYPTLIAKTGTSKLLNAYKALTSLDKGVALNGILANNTAKMGARAFASNQDLKNPQINTSALNATADESSEEPAETIAMFSRELLNAMRSGRSAEVNLKPHAQHQNGSPSPSQIP